MEHKIYRCDIEISGDAAIELLVGEEVPDGYVLEVTHMMIADSESDDKMLELGYVTQTDEYKVLAINRRETYFEHHLTGNVWLMAGEKPYARVTTSEDEDEIYFSCHGKLWPVK